MFSTFPEDARLNAERQAVEFGVEIRRGPHAGQVRRRVFQGCSRSGPRPRGASRRTTYSGRGSRPSPSGSCAGVG